MLQFIFIEIDKARFYPSNEPARADPLSLSSSPYRFISFSLSFSTPSEPSYLSLRPPALSYLSPLLPFSPSPPDSLICSPPPFLFFSLYPPHLPPCLSIYPYPPFLQRLILLFSHPLTSSVPPFLPLFPLSLSLSFLFSYSVSIYPSTSLFLH